MTFLQELLTFMGLEGRLHLAWISSAEAQRFVQVVTEFTEKIRTLGPNPLAGYTRSLKAAGLKFPSDFGKGRIVQQQKAAVTIPGSRQRRQI